MDLNSYSKDIMADNLIIKYCALLLLNFEVINIGCIWINSHCIGLTHIIDCCAGKYLFPHYFLFVAVLQLWLVSI